MKRVFFLIIAFMFALSLIRIGNDSTYMSLESFFRALSRVDLDFSETLLNIAKVREKLNFPVLGDLNIFEAVKEFFKWVYNLFKALGEVPLSIFKDILSFVSSCGDFFRALVGL